MARQPISRARRLWRHLVTDRGHVHGAFPPEELVRVENAIAEGERRHSGQVCFAIEAALPAARVWQGVSPRERALEVFGLLRVWDTEHNDGVLVYVLLADGAIELVADRAVAARIPQPEWDGICRRIETEFAVGRYREGAIAAIEAVGAQLARHFPAQRGESDELPNQPILL